MGVATSEPLQSHELILSLFELSNTYNKEGNHGGEDDGNS
jgi:hypothetical protein